MWRDWTARAVRCRVDGLRRDLGMIADQLGGKPPPTVMRAPTPRAHRPRRANPLAERSLSVAAVERLTPDAVEIRLATPDGSPLDYRAGQFLSVIVELDGERVRRPYSFCTAPGGPGDEPPTLGVKRVAGGRVSTHLVDGVRAGDVLRVTGPSGAFTVDADPEGARHRVMLAGGSGITPLLSLTRFVLDAEPRSRVTMVYGNRGEADVMFREALDALEARYAGRLRVDHVLHAPSAGWRGPTGLLDARTLAARLDALGVEDDARTDWFLCGPEPMMASARALLSERGVDRARVREERFTADDPRGAGARRGSTRAETVTVHLPDGRMEAALVRPGQTLLAAALAAGIELPFSCTMGGCGACRVRLRSGDVDLDEPNCLRDDERADGFVLACSSHPHGATEIEVAS